MDLYQEPTPFKRLMSALFYGTSSILIMVVNKSVLTSYKFPSALFLGLGQMIAGIGILLAAKILGYITFPNPSLDVSKKIFPLPLLYLGNLAFGLGGTKKISLPMFTVLRRFTVLITMVLEVFILRSKPSKAIVITVLAMIGGSIMAASDDLAFDLIGYIFIFCNNIFTASNNVYVKKRLNDKELGKYGIIFYNSLFMIVPCVILLYCIGDFEKSLQFNDWKNPAFVFQFGLSCVMGFILTFSVTLCTAYNSALTTTVVGCIKNIAITYIGMVFGGDYIFSWTNFIGINISVVGGVVYSYIVFLTRNKQSEEKKKSLEPTKTSA